VTSKHTEDGEKRGQPAHSGVTGQEHPVTLVHQTKHPPTTSSSEEKPGQVAAASEQPVSRTQQVARS